PTTWGTRNLYAPYSFDKQDRLLLASFPQDGHDMLKDRYALQKSPRRLHRISTIIPQPLVVHGPYILGDEHSDMAPSKLYRAPEQRPQTSVADKRPKRVPRVLLPQRKDKRGEVSPRATVGGHNLKTSIGGGSQRSYTIA